MNTFDNISPNNIHDAVKALLAQRLATARFSQSQVVDMTINLFAALNLIDYSATGTSLDEVVAEGGHTDQIPAVRVEHSIEPDYIICLEDGKRFKMMKRHLREAYDMSPDQYRNKWGLPSDYPMTAPNYAASKSQSARNSGLGKHDRGPAGNGFH